MRQLFVHRAVVDDASAAALLAQMAGKRLGEEERPTQVDVQHLIIIVRLRVEERRVPLHTGIVDQDVQLPHLRDALAHQPVALLDVTDIGGDEAHPPAQGADLLEALAGLFVVLAAVDDNVGALFSQAHGNAAADALGAAGDQSHLILQAHCHPPHAPIRVLPFRLAMQMRRAQAAERSPFLTNGAARHAAPLC